MDLRVVQVAIMAAEKVEMVLIMLVAEEVEVLRILQTFQEYCLLYLQTELRCSLLQEVAEELPMV